MNRWTNVIRSWNLERSLLLFLLAVSAMVRIVAEGYPREARIFPVLVSSVTIVLLIVALILHFRADVQSDAESSDSEVDGSGGAGETPSKTVSWWKTAMGSVGLLLLMYMFGLGAGMAIYYPLFARALGMPLKVGIPVGVLFGVAIRFALGSIFQLPMPAGMLVDLF